MVKKIFIGIGHVKIVTIYTAKFNVSILNRLRFFFFFLQIQSVYINLMSFLIKLQPNILTKYFFHIQTLQTTLSGFECINNQSNIFSHI